MSASHLQQTSPVCFDELNNEAFTLKFMSGGEIVEWSFYTCLYCVYRNGVDDDNGLWPLQTTSKPQTSREHYYITVSNYW